MSKTTKEKSLSERTAEALFRCQKHAQTYDQPADPLSDLQRGIREADAAVTARLERDGKELERLRAIVARLPKTADGVPIIVGMSAWYVYSDRAWLTTVEAITADGVSALDRDWDEDPWQLNNTVPFARVYSTEAAARAALSTK